VRGLGRGFLTPDEVARGILAVLAEAPDHRTVWADVTEPAKEVVLAYLERVGPGGVPPPFRIGPAAEPELLAAEHARLRAVAVKLLAEHRQHGKSNCNPDT